MSVMSTIKHLGLIFEVKVIFKLDIVIKIIVFNINLFYVLCLIL
jgi:hypothetical protein